MKTICKKFLTTLTITAVLLNQLFTVAVFAEGMTLSFTDTPANPTSETTAQFTVEGSNITHYRHKIDDLEYGEDIEIENSTFTYFDLSFGEHTVYVLGVDSEGNVMEEPLTYTWLISEDAGDGGDAGGEIEMWFDDGPDYETLETSASFTVGGTNLVAYKHKIDDLEYSEEISIETPTFTYSDLTVSEHTVSVLGKDAEGNWTEEPITYTWWILEELPDGDDDTGDDDTEPDSQDPIDLGNFTLIEYPVDPTEETTATFTLDSESYTAYMHKLNDLEYSEEFEIENSTFSYLDLEPGEYTLYLLGKDSEGNWSETPETYSWTIGEIADDDDDSGDDDTGDDDTGDDDTDEPLEIGGFIFEEHPDLQTTETSANFVITSEVYSNFKYALDEGGYGETMPLPEGGTFSYSDLSVGWHTLHLLGYDDEGSSEATFSWEIVTDDTGDDDDDIDDDIDDIEPIDLGEITLIDHPADPTTETQATFSIESETYTAYMHKLDDLEYSEEFEISNSTFTYFDLPLGEHTLYLLGKDAEGNWAETAEIFTWEIVEDDGDNPDHDGDDYEKVEFIVSPSNPTTSTDATFVFTSGDATHYTYVLDDGPDGEVFELQDYNTIEFTGLSLGEHTLHLWCKDEEDEWYETTFTWEIVSEDDTGDDDTDDDDDDIDDIEPIDLGNFTLLDHPADPTEDTNATFTVQSDVYTHYMHKLDDLEYTEEFEISNSTFTYFDLAPGEHTLYLLGKDAEGNWAETAETFTWTIGELDDDDGDDNSGDDDDDDGSDPDDVPGPEITGLTNDPNPTKSKTWTWGSTSANVQFRFLIDQNSTATLTGDYANTTTATQATGDGTYYLHVQAKDENGNESAVMTVSALLDNTAPKVVFGPITLNPNSDTTASIVIGGEDVSHYKFQLDGAAYGNEDAVTNPLLLKNVSNGEHTLSVVGRDLAGNYQAENEATTYKLLINNNPTVSSGGGGGGGGGYFLRNNNNRNNDLSDSADIDLQSDDDVAQPFKDIKFHWAEDYIDDLRLQGVVQGKMEGIFSPDSALTRAELVKIVLELFDISVPSSVSTEPFSDVSTSQWYAVYISAAKDAGIVDGYGNGTFRPNQNINRAEALKILLEAANVALVEGDVSFTDVPKTGWFYRYVVFAVKNGVANGYGNGMFGPGNFITRAEFAKMASLVADL